MAKRKYTRINEKPVRFECTNKKCKWKGTEGQKSTKRVDESMTEDVCPNCGNNEFYGLLQ